MLLYQLLRFGESLRLETIVRVEFHGWFDPELGLTIGVLHMYMRPRLLAREEVEPKPLQAQDRRAHSHRIAHAHNGSQAHGADARGLRRRKPTRIVGARYVEPTGVVAVLSGR